MYYLYNSTICIVFFINKHKNRFQPNYSEDIEEKKVHYFNHQEFNEYLIQRLYLHLL